MTLGGNDVIVGPKGGEWRDLFCTGPGDDQVIYVGGRYVDRLDSEVDLGPGDDRMTVTSPEIRFIRAGSGDDTILFGRKSGAVVVPGPGDDLIRGPALRGDHGTTCIDLRTARGPVRIDLARGRATGEGHDRFPRNTRCAVGGRFDDVLLGTPGNDKLNAGDGDDKLNAGDGDDELKGGGGDDKLDPGYGADLVRAGAGNDDVWSGWIYYYPARGEGGDRIYLGPGDDWGDGGPGADRLYGGPGSDSLAGAPGSDYLDGGPGDDYPTCRRRLHSARRRGNRRPPPAGSVFRHRAQRSVRPKRKRLLVRGPRQRPPRRRSRLRQR